MYRTTLRNTGETSSDFHSLDGINPHHGIRNLSIQPIEYGLNPAPGPSLCHYRNTGTHRITFIPHFIQIRLQLWNNATIWCKKCIFLYGIPRLEGYGDFSKLAHITANRHTITLLKPLLGYCARSYSDCCFTCAGATTTAIVAYAVFLPVGIICVARTKGFGNFAVVMTTLIFVSDQKSNGCTCCPTFEYTRQYLDSV